mgnify:CR=1 FL=1
MNIHDGNPHDLSTNGTRIEEYEIQKPPPTSTIEELIKHKNNNICSSEMDWLVNYKPPPPKDETPDWTNFKLLGRLLSSRQISKDEKSWP